MTCYDGWMFDLWIACHCHCHIPVTHIYVKSRSNLTRAKGKTDTCLLDEYKRKLVQQNLHSNSANYNSKFKVSEPAKWLYLIIPV